ncbi:ROK family protein [Lederbergia graminis]|uniref:ROK family protein n=1 Tax=Lederbergia graminis TaxID=735518 RepID=A0ABW0LEB6_9BACI
MTKQLRKGNKDLIKELNRSLVINQIRLNGPISRTTLAKNTNLGLSTITNIVDSLISESYVNEVGAGSSNGGRKPILLKFNENIGSVIGIKIEPKQIIMAIADFNAKIMRKISFDLEGNITKKAMLSKIIDKMESLLSTLDKEQKLNGIGIAISGIVNPSKKILDYSPILNWKDIDFQPLEKHFNVPVLIDNDANVFSLAHLWDGVGKVYNHYIGVTFGVGIGAGIVINRTLFRGNYGGAGEFGHMIIERNGKRCYCGQNGCLEMYTSDQYLIQEAADLHLANTDVDSINIDTLYVAAENGNKDIQQLLIKQGKNLGVGLKSVINFLNPEAIILGGEGLRGMPYVKDGILQEVENNFFSGYEKKINVHISDLGDDVWLIGACALVLEEIFTSPIYK